MKKEYIVKREVRVNYNTKVGHIQIEITKGLSQKRLKELYNAGYSNFIDEVKIEPKKKEINNKSQSSTKK